MDKKGVAELKRRFTKENCTFTRLCGCYVDAGKDNNELTLPSYSMALITVE